LLFLLTCRLVAYALNSLDLEKGSAIAIDMPMNVKSVVIYLAIVLAGYVVVSIADSFAASEISNRLRISNAKVVFTQVDSLISSDTFLVVYIWVFFNDFSDFLLGKLNSFISVETILILSREGLKERIEIE